MAIRSSTALAFGLLAGGVVATLGPHLWTWAIECYLRWRDARRPDGDGGE